MSPILLRRPDIRCNKIQVCLSIRERIVDSGHGFRLVYTAEDLNGDRVWCGVAYHRDAADGGVMIERCPFCGGAPGCIGA